MFRCQGNANRMTASSFVSVNKLSLVLGAVLICAIFTLVVHMATVTQFSVLPSDSRCIQGASTAQNATVKYRELIPSQNKNVPQEWREKMRRRTQHVRNTCKKYHLQRDFNDNMIGQFYVEDRSRIVFCSIPKVGCSNWKRIILVLSANVNKTDLRSLVQFELHHGSIQYRLQLLSSFTKFGVRFRLKHYLKFMFVRHPLERILSAYRDKLETGDNVYYMRSVGKQIVKNFKANASKAELETGSNVTFTEFLKFILSEHRKNIQLDVHWRPYMELAYPCAIPYDIIGKYETIEEDANNILRLISADHVVRYPPSEQTSKTSDLVKRYYEKIDKKLLQEVWAIYARDAELFDYKLDKFL
ncbi:carbohydrate sulfotransferase 8 [Lingula anatina]|uniref:Carbohydrate sulfotransferase n=1 Tax=Lingula anatina TaxID=7574 RepID=A0A1S3I6W7_LINAN|nr:carbohydrate sulfotransferase 8 [Lingula anatina]|eukprot:XP_013393109.1 carbohydrate sulfotransferase 8 [Lingula anatina]